MKKLSSILLGIAILFGIGAPLLKENNAKVAEATDYEIVTDTFTIYEFPEDIGASAQSYNFTGTDSKCDYNFITKRGYGSNVIPANDRTKTFLFPKSPSDPYGVVSTNEIGYVRSIEVEFLSITGTGGFPKLNLYLSDNAYVSPQDLLYGRQGDLYSFFDKDTKKIVIEDDFKYFGLRTEYSSSTTDCYIKSLKIEWELHDFSKTAEVSSDMADGLRLKCGETYKVNSSGSGDGEYTGNEVLYKSSNSDVFTVDKNGVITAVGSGTAKLRVQYGFSYLEYEIVVDPFYDITIDISSTATKVQKVTDLHEGDIVYIVCESQEKVLSRVSHIVGDEDFIGEAVDCEIDKINNSVNICEGGELFCVYGDADTGFRFVSTILETISFEDDEDWTGLYTDFPDDRWNVTINEEITTIANKSNENYMLLFDVECDGFDVMESGDDVAIYKFDNSGSNRIVLLDTEEAEDSYALSFAKKFLDTFKNVCDLNGNTNIDTLKDKWHEIFFETCDEFENLNGISLLMLKNAESNENGDYIQRAVSLYEYIVGKYAELQDMNYLDRNIPQRAYYGGLMSNTLDDNVDVMLILVISFSSLTLCTGALLIRKKKRI